MDVQPFKKHRVEALDVDANSPDDAVIDVDEMATSAWRAARNTVRRAGAAINAHAASTLRRTVAAASSSMSAAAAASLAVNGAAYAAGSKEYLDPAQPARGWIVRGRIPKELRLGARDGSSLKEMLALRPSDPGKVMMFGSVVDTPRHHQAYGQDYNFSGVHHPAVAVPAPVAELMDWANAQRHEWRTPAGSSSSSSVDGSEAPLFSSALVNWYMHGQHYIGPHRDDERALHFLSPIFSASLGETRVFRIRDWKTKAVVRDVELRDGDFVVMGGRMQSEFTHEIVKVNGAKGLLMGPRVNITFRQMREWVPKAASVATETAPIDEPTPEVSL
jgi:alkylated DNA repair dioxygenase AlkB